MKLIRKSFIIVALASLSSCAPTTTDPIGGATNTVIKAAQLKNAVTSLTGILR